MSRLPAVPAAVPRTQASWFSIPGKAATKLMGWGVETPIPDIPRCVMTAAPHSSNWDLIVAVLIAAGLRIRFNWLGKHTLFERPFGWIVKGVGGIPTVRNARSGAVAAAAARFASSDKLWLVIAPEGTRQGGEPGFKTGFYHIAKAANVPIVPGYLHYPRKAIGFGPPIMPSDDVEQDFVKLYAFYNQFEGKKGKKIALPADVEKALAAGHSETPQP